MNQVSICQINKQEGQNVEISGWLTNRRSSGKILFLEIRDGTGWIQAVVSQAEVSEPVFALASEASLESSITVRAVVKRDNRSALGFELQVVDFLVYQQSAEFPIGKKEHGPDFLLDQRHLWLRSKTQWAVLKVRDEVIFATYEWMHQNSYTKIDTPIFTPNSCEGTTTLFPVNYFGQTVYLTQSGQLYLEAAISAFGKVFDFGPVFRAEKSKTRRHLIEFWMMDAEAAFVDHAANLKIQESMMRHIICRVVEHCGYALQLLERDTKVLEKYNQSFTQITYDEAVKMVQKSGSTMAWGDDFGAPDETIISKQFEVPVFVEKYPKQVKAFYMKVNPENDKTVLCSDLLAPEGYGEIIGGSQREDDYERLIERVKATNLEMSDFQWYLDLRRFGSVTHSGFGYGLERIVTWLCGRTHVRESIPFPRLLNRVRP